MRYVELNNGALMPMLGFGVYRLINPGVCEKAVEQALEAGFRLMDTASAYHNESAVGKALAASGIARQELFVTGKLWLTEASESEAEAALRRSLSRLGLEYFDLYLVHQPWGEWHGAWRTLERLRKEGLARAIGVSNFAPDRAAELLALHEVAPAVDQLEINPFCQREEERAWLCKKGIVPQAWAPLAHAGNGIFENPVLESIAAAHGVAIAQIVLAWLLARGVPAVVQSTNPERLRQNMDIFHIELTEAEMERIASLNTGKSCFYSHNDPDIVEKFCSRRTPTREELLRACRIRRMRDKKEGNT